MSHCHLDYVLHSNSGPDDSIGPRRTGAGTGRKLLYGDTQTASFSGGSAQQDSNTAAYQSDGTSSMQAATGTQVAPVNQWQNALNTIQRSATAAFNANTTPVQQQQQQTQVCYRLQQKQALWRARVPHMATNVCPGACFLFCCLEWGAVHARNGG